MRKFFLFALTVFLAFMLNAAPLPASVLAFMPNWVFLVLCFWLVKEPQNVGLAAVFVVGLLMDAFQGVLLGEHVIAMLIPAALLLQLGPRVRQYTLWQQMILVLVLVFLYQLLFYCLEGFVGHLVMPFSYWAGPVIAMLCWPLVYGFFAQHRVR